MDAVKYELKIAKARYFCPFFRLVLFVNGFLCHLLEARVQEKNSIISLSYDNLRMYECACAVAFIYANFF